MAEPRDPSATGERPTVWLNCAVSLDGKLAFAGGARARLSSPEDLLRVHRLRAEVDGIVVGVGTVVLDDPSLAVRWDLLHEPPRAAPHRIVLDASGRTPPGARVLDGSAPTIVATSARNQRGYPPPVRTLVAGATTVEPRRLLEALRELGLRRLLVEGGTRVFTSLVREGLFDRWTIYYAPVAIGGSTAPPLLAGAETAGFDTAVRMELAGVERAGEGYVATYVPRASGAR